MRYELLRAFLHYCLPVKLSLEDSSLGSRELDSFKGLLSPQLYYVIFTSR